MPQHLSPRAQHLPRGSWAWLVILAVCSGTLACAPSESGPPPVAELSQKVEYKNVTLTVNTAEKTDALGADQQRLEQVSRPITAGEGKTFLVVNVTIENKTPYRLQYQAGQFALQDSSGAAYSPGVATGARPLGRGELEPTKDASGIINFIVPRDARDFVLKYRIPNQQESLSVRLGV